MYIPHEYNFSAKDFERAFNKAIETDPFANYHIGKTNPFDYTKINSADDYYRYQRERTYMNMVDQYALKTIAQTSKEYKEEIENHRTQIEQLNSQIVQLNSQVSSLDEELSIKRKLLSSQLAKRRLRFPAFFSALCLLIALFMFGYFKLSALPKVERQAAHQLEISVEEAYDNGYSDGSYKVLAETKDKYEKRISKLSEDAKQIATYYKALNNVHNNL